MTGKIKGFTKLFMDELRVKKSDIAVNHSIIHQENLCSKILGFEDITKKVVQSVNFQSFSSTKSSTIQINT